MPEHVGACLGPGGGELTLGGPCAPGLFAEFAHEILPAFECIRVPALQGRGFADGGVSGPGCTFIA